jgi:hypothetical protein
MFSSTSPHYKEEILPSFVNIVEQKFLLDVSLLNAETRNLVSPFTSVIFTLNWLIVSDRVCVNSWRSGVYRNKYDARMEVETVMRRRTTTMQISTMRER